MEKFALPLSEFEMFDESHWTGEDEKGIVNRILNTPDDDEVGYIVEADLAYPNELHDLHTLHPTKGLN